MKIVEFLEGPYGDGELVWMVCEVTDCRGNFWIEEVFYDTFEDAYDDWRGITDEGIDIDEYDYIEEEDY